MDIDPARLTPLRVAGARFRLEPVPERVQAVVDAAAELLGDGVDTTGIRILAGDDGVDPWELGEDLDRALGELGLESYGRNEAYEVIAEPLARQLLDGRIAVEEAAQQLWDLHPRLFDPDPPSEVSDLLYAADGVRHIPEFVSEDDLRSAARRFLDSLQGPRDG